jgi:hypothetical protein
MVFFYLILDRSFVAIKLSLTPPDRGRATRMTKERNQQQSQNSAASAAEYTFRLAMYKCGGRERGGGGAFPGNRRKQPETYCATAAL